MYVTSKKAQQHFSVAGETLRQWAEKNKIKVKITTGGHRRYFIQQNIKKKRESIIYCRVSSTKQKSDLDHQITVVQQIYPEHRVIKDIGSGLNFKRLGFISLLDSICNGCIKSVVVTDKDRLGGIGVELFEYICKRHGTKIIILSKKKQNNSTTEF